MMHREWKYIGVATEGESIEAAYPAISTEPRTYAWFRSTVPHDLFDEVIFFRLHGKTVKVMEAEGKLTVVSGKSNVDDEEVRYCHLIIHGIYHCFAEVYCD